MTDSEKKPEGPRVGYLQMQADLTQAQQALAEKDGEVERLRLLCLSLRDALNDYHRTKLQSALDEVNRLAGMCNSPKLMELPYVKTVLADMRKSDTERIAHQRLLAGYDKEEIATLLTERDDAVRERDGLQVAFDAAIQEIHIGRHGASGMCCQLRLREKRRAENAEAERDKLASKRRRVCDLCGCVVTGLPGHPCIKCGATEGRPLILAYFDLRTERDKLKEVVDYLPVDAEGNTIIPTRQTLWKSHYGKIYRTSDIYYNHLMRRWAVTLKNKTRQRTCPTSAWADECYKSHAAARQAAAAPGEEESDGLEAFDGPTRRAAAEGMFNSEQLDDMRYLSSLPREDKCACGWYRKGECPHCKPAAAAKAGGGE